VTDRSRPNPDCEDCFGSGESFGHSAGCRSRICVLAGGIEDCDGQVYSCPCWDNPKACIACGTYEPEDSYAKGWRSVIGVDAEARLRCPECQRGDVDQVW